MIGSFQNGEARLELAAARFAQALRSTAEVLDREIVPRLGFRGMMAATLPALALLQVVLPGVPFLGGARVPFLWCAVLYYVIQFRFSRAIEAAAAGAALCWLAGMGAFWPDCAVLFATSVAFATLRGRIYTEFWPAHAFAGGLVAIAVPLASWVCGNSSPAGNWLSCVGTACMAPVVSVAVFGMLEWARRRIDLDPDLPHHNRLLDETQRARHSYFAGGAGV